MLSFFLMVCAGLGDDSFLECFFCVLEGSAFAREHAGLPAVGAAF